MVNGCPDDDLNLASNSQFDLDVLYENDLKVL